MSRRENWRSQKARKAIICLLAAPAEEGREFGYFRREGQMDSSMMSVQEEPIYALILMMLDRKSQMSRSRERP